MLNIFTWVTILMILLIVKYIFILPKEDRQLFELYEVRDDISIATMQGKIDQESRAYRFVIDNINFWIYNTRNNYDFTIALSNVVRASKMERGVLDNLIYEIEENPILVKGLKKFSLHSQRVMRIKGKIFWGVVMFSITMMIGILEVLYKICNIGQKTIKILTEKLDRSRELKEQYDYYTNKVVCRR